MVEIIRVNDGRDQKTSFCIIDAQSVKNTDTAENKGYREKRLKEWQRQWKIDLIEKDNPTWKDLYTEIAC